MHHMQNENMNLVHHLIVGLNLRPILKGRQTQKILNISSFFSPAHTRVQGSGGRVRQGPSAAFSLYGEAITTRILFSPK